MPTQTQATVTGNRDQSKRSSAGVPVGQLYADADDKIDHARQQVEVCQGNCPCEHARACVYACACLWQSHKSAT